jgi:hypothetical protein
VLTVLAVTLLVWAILLGWRLMRIQPPGLDFLPLWTAGQMAWRPPRAVYDFVAVTRAQGWLLPDFRWLRPYAYPPTMLLVLAPLGLVPFWTALILWMAISLSLFVYASSRLVPKATSVALAALLPPVVVAALAGQTVLLVGSLATLAVTELPRRPRLAGLLMGVAAAMKPQALLMAPFALLADCALEAAIVAASTLSGLALLSVTIFGPQIWASWFAALPRFQQVVERTPGIAAALIAPSAFVATLGLGAPVVDLSRWVFAAAAALFVLSVWSRVSNSSIRAVALLGGALFATPYAVSYDTAALAPAAAAMMLNTTGERTRLMRLTALLALCLILDYGVLALIAFAILMAASAPPRNTPAAVSFDQPF